MDNPTLGSRTNKLRSNSNRFLIDLKENVHNRVGLKYNTSELKAGDRNALRWGKSAPIDAKGTKICLLGST